MKHDSGKYAVPVLKICNGEKIVHSPLSPPIEMSKKHLGLLFSDIFHAKRKRKLSLHTRKRGWIRSSCMTPWNVLPCDTQKDTAEKSTDCQSKWLLDDVENCFSRGRSHALSLTQNVQQNEDSDFYRGICSFYPWSVVSRCGVSKTTSRSLPWVIMIVSWFVHSGLSSLWGYVSAFNTLLSRLPYLISPSTLLIEPFDSRTQSNLIERLGSINFIIKQNRTQKFVWKSSIAFDFRTNRTQSNPSSNRT